MFNFIKYMVVQVHFTIFIMTEDCATFPLRDSDSLYTLLKNEFLLNKKYKTALMISIFYFNVKS